MKSDLVRLFESKPKGYYPTDKHDENHTVFGKSYLDIYGEIFAPIRLEVTSVLELGVLSGGSLRLWHDYFPNARVVGIDIDPKASAHAKEDVGIYVVTGSQDDPAAIANAGQIISDQFDVVIDDGSHVVDHMIASSDTIFKDYMNRGGWYVMEDMSCTYQDVDSGWPGMKLNPELPFNVRSKMNNGIINCIEQMDHRQGRIASLRVFPMMLFWEINPKP